MLNRLLYVTLPHIRSYIPRYRICWRATHYEFDIIPSDFSIRPTGSRSCDIPDEALIEYGGADVRYWHLADIALVAPHMSAIGGKADMACTQNVRH